MGSRIFELLYYFVKIVDYGGINKAAKAINVSAGTLSNAITSIEQVTGTQLLIRNSAGITLTVNGELYYNQFSPLISEFNNKLLLINSQKMIADDELNVILPPRLSLTYIVNKLNGFTTQNPQLMLHISYHYQDVSLLGEKFDIALSGIIPAKKDYFVQAFVHVKVRIYTTNTYIEKYGEPKTIADLRHHNVVIVSASNTFKYKYVFFNTQTGNHEEVELKRNTCTSDAMFNLKLLGEGDHIVFALENSFLDNLPKNRKVMQILTQYRLDPQTFYLIRPTKEPDLRVDLFIDFLKQCFNSEDLAK